MPPTALAVIRTRAPSRPSTAIEALWASTGRHVVEGAPVGLDDERAGALERDVDRRRPVAEDPGATLVAARPSAGSTSISLISSGRGLL